MSRKLDHDSDSRLFLDYCPLKSRAEIESGRRKDILCLLLIFCSPIVAIAIIIAFLSGSSGFISLFEAYEPWFGPLLFGFCALGITLPLCILIDHSWSLTWPRPLSWVDYSDSDKALSALCLTYPELNDYRQQVIEMGRRLTREEYQKMQSWPENKTKQIEHRALRRSYGLREDLHVKG